MEEILQKLMITEKPITKWVHQNKSFAITAIGLKKGNTLKKHLIRAPTSLIMLQGKINCSIADLQYSLNVFESLEIPINQQHQIDAVEDAIFLLIKNKLEEKN